MSIGDKSGFPRKPEQIRSRQFASVRKGYDPDQVQDFLAQIADQVNALEADLRAAREELERASGQQVSARDEAYQELAKRMADILSMADEHAGHVRKEADQEADQVRAEAKEEAERTRKEAESEGETRLREAKSEAERVIREARIEAEQLRRENDEAMRKTRSEAEQIVSVLASRRDMLLTEVQGTRERLMGVLDKINSPVAPSPTEPPQQAPPPAPEWEAEPATAHPERPQPNGPETAEAEPRRNGAWKPQQGQERTWEPEASDRDDQELGLMLPEVPALEEELEG